MQYISTRDGMETTSFSEVLLSGLAQDGGLYLPKTYPKIEIDNEKPLNAAAHILSHFVDKNFSEQNLLTIVQNAWRGFPEDNPAPLYQLDENCWLLNLFQGPTLAFKDYGLKFLAECFRVSGQPLLVFGATSGDTGAAAVHALAGIENVKLVMLHPKGRISDMQRRQMTTVRSDNIFNIAIEGTFDDCQSLLKKVLAEPFQGSCRITTINSINWGRILAQSIYYRWACIRLNRQLHFIVPSGNFGNAFSGYVAMRSGAPVDGITIATNTNDILLRAFETCIYKPAKTITTLSPAMDIQAANNFERLIFEETGRDGLQVKRFMENLKQTGCYQIPKKIINKAKRFFSAVSVSEDETLSAIKYAYQAFNVVIDPHTAVGFAAMQRSNLKQNIPMVLLATAHPAKFSDTIHHAIGMTPTLPEALSCLMDQKEYVFHLGADIEGLRTFIKKEVL